MLRLFVAIRPPAPVRDLLIDTMEGLPGARWQDEDQLHLTLRFVGEVDRHAAEDLAEALAAIRAPRFELAIRGVGHFERKGRPHTLWAGLTPSPELAVLQKKVERACQAAGLTPERRKFAAHVTVARLSGGSGPADPWLAQQENLRSEPWSVEDFRLYSSDLSPAGAIYEPLVRYPLQT
jgi:RNA 2',3'-cyclic 3'-phosphodiesterase